MWLYIYVTGFYLQIKMISPQLIICSPHFIIWFGGNNPDKNGILVFSLDLFHGSTGGSQVEHLNGRLEMGMLWFDKIQWEILISSSKLRTIPLIFFC